MTNAPVKVIAFGLVACAASCKKSQANAEPPVVSAPALDEAQPPPDESPLEKAQKATTLSAALEITTPHMDDAPNDVSKGTILLAAWAAKSMRWADVAVPKDETSFALVMKDTDNERGKRLCVSGNIIEITVEKTDVGKLHDGLLMNNSRRIYKFIAVGSSGALVERSRARLCGVVTGRFSYSNSGGGTSHAIKVVGMFDLPENRGK